MNEELKKALNAPLDHKLVKQFGNNSGAKSGLSYLEGHDVIRKLNEVFEHNWSHRVKDLQCLGLQEYKSKYDKEMVNPYFTCIVEMSVHTDDFHCTHDGVGGGSANMPAASIGEAYEFAAKEAETDAIKRAAMKLGDPFGLALYDKEQANVSKPYNAKLAATQLMRDVEAKHKLERDAAVDHISKCIESVVGEKTTFVHLSEEQAQQVAEKALSTKPQKGQ